MTLRVTRPAPDRKNRGGIRIDDEEAHAPPAPVHRGGGMSWKRMTAYVLAAGWLAVSGPQGCGAGPPTDPGDEGLVAARGGGGGGKATTDVKVSALDPDTVPADTILTIRVLGSGFTAGSQVSWQLAGSPTTKVSTSGPVIFVSSKELEAPVTVQADAPLTSYDVVVSAAGGKKGIGVELLEVVAKFNPLPEPSSAYQSVAHDVTHAGVIVGGMRNSSGDRQALRWVPSGEGWVYEDLGSGEAVAVNEQGYVLILDWPDATHSAWRSRVRTPSGVEIDLGEVWVNGISETGTILGAIQNGARWTYVAWRRLSETTWDEPTILPGTASHPYASHASISRTEDIAGWVSMGVLDADEWPVIWTFDGVGWSGPIPVDTQQGGRAHVVGARGTIAGGSAPCTAGCPKRPTYWPAAGAVRELLADPWYGRVSGGGSTASAVDMNQADQIVGTALVPMNKRGRAGALVDHAVAWLSPSAVEYLDLGAAKAGGFSYGYAVNDHGLVVGLYRDEHGRGHAVAWRLP